MDDYRRFDNKEFDVDTGTYMEDVHSNDVIGIDKDGDGLIDNVEELVEDAAERAEEYNAERDRQAREARERDDREEEEEAKRHDDFSLGAGM